MGSNPTNNEQPYAVYPIPTLKLVLNHQLRLNNMVNQLHIILLASERLIQMGTITGYLCRNEQKV